MITRFLKYALSIVLALFLFACGNKQNETASLSCADFTVQNFSPLANWQTDSTHKTIHLDYAKAVEGFIIPTVQQIKDGVFFFNFEIKNTSAQKQPFYYKIFYQNESYKFPEYDSVNKGEHQFAEENFYGSWEDLSFGFKKSEEIPADNNFHKIEDYFRIVGNPRGEDRYKENGQNNRWKRNLRVGEYSFLLVVATKEELDKIPNEIQFIDKKAGEHFTHPYVYFLHGDKKEDGNLVVSKTGNYLKVVAQPNLGTGVYIDTYMFGEEVNRDLFCKTCGRDQNLFENAPVQQFVNYVDESTKMYNIPVISDVIKDNYSKQDYNWNKKFYTKDELIPTYIQTAKKRPCSTVYSDSVNKKIVLKNPKTTYGEWKKESVGIITRHGLTYGKYRVKVKLTELVNKSGVWNGLTNAIWLITQGGGKWNFRRNCNKEGFMETYWGGRDDKRVPAIDYSEIDFEILKTPPYCPDNSFPPVYKNPTDNYRNVNNWNVALPNEIGDNDDNITVACTNWDMACWEPKNFGVGCNTVSYKGQEFYTHRWDHWYRALTEKSEQSDNELFQGDYYYFEIDWRPTEIIWRIGKDPKKMKVVGYMNDQITSIPNNQMLLIITQEFHNTKWWPGTPYSQDNIPFPKNDIYGEVLDLTIE